MHISKSFTKKSVLIAAVSALCTLSSFARVGDTQKDIQARLTARGGAYKYLREEYLREALELPYSNLFLIQTDDTKNSFFFKRCDSIGSSNLDTLNQGELFGWEVHVAYQNDVSVLESYRRYGDPMTYLEVKGLMDLMVKDKEGVTWKRANYVEYTPAEKNQKDVEYAMLFQKNKDRFVYLTAPSTVGKSSNYFSSIPFYIWEDERKATLENYNRILEQDRKLAEARTAVGNASKAKGSTKNFAESDVVFNRKTVIRFGSGNMSSFGEALPNKRTKDVWLGLRIPNQADTFIGYNFETSDGSLRALINNNMIVFVDASYDKSLRENLEKLYEKQEARRQRDAENSLSNF